MSLKSSLCNYLEMKSTGSIFSCLFLLYNLSLAQVQSQQCGPLTTRDVEGPFFVSNAELSYEIAPYNEITDPTQGVVLRGQVSQAFNLNHIYLCFHVQVLDRNCNGIAGATVEVWYAGGASGKYYQGFFDKSILYHYFRYSNLLFQLNTSSAQTNCGTEEKLKRIKLVHLTNPL